MALLSVIIFVASVVGVAVHFLFYRLGWIPDPSTAQVAELQVEMNYKLVSNVLATAFFLALYWLHRTDSFESGRRDEMTHSAD